MRFWYTTLIFLVFASACQKLTEKLPDVTSGLVVDIPLNGNAVELISGREGVIQGVVPTANRHGQLNKAMLFSDVDSNSINFGDWANASLASNRFTISCWVQVADTSERVAVLSKRGPFGPFEYSLDTYFGLGRLTLDNWEHQGGSTVYGVDPLKAGAPIRPNEWQHVAFVADGASLRVYVDGELQQGEDLRQGTHTFVDTDADFIIGNGGAWAKNHYFNGAIDDVKLYNRPLSDKAIDYLAKQ